MSEPFTPGTPPPAPYPNDGAPLPGAPTHHERQWGMFAHLSQLLGLVIPLGSIIGPLVIWLVKKDESAYVGWHGKEALNFEITIHIAVFILIIAGFVTCGIGWALAALVGIYSLIMAIIAAIRANEGKQWRYPATIRMIS